MRVEISLLIVAGGLLAARRLYHDYIGAMVGKPLYSLIAVMDPSPFASSESEESDFTAEDRWESEGGNPGQLRQLPVHKREEIATEGAHASFSDMPKRKRKLDVGGSRSIPKRERSESASPKQRKQLAHNAPARRAASKFRE